jgi:S-(hydroxymethyl)glutathione dehydrogenase/alcohol dehydrogenase
MSKNRAIAAVLYEINKKLKIEELVIPKLSTGQILVRVAYSGVCHSQLNEMRGLKGEDKYLPHTLGHEGSGIVEEIGPNVNKVKKGDHVVLTWIKCKGVQASTALYKNKKGDSINSGAIATFLTRTVVSENRIVKINNEMPLREAALLGCAIPTGAGMVINTARVKKSSTVAIFGVGGIGLSAVMASSLLGVKQIIAIDINDYKLNLAKKCGASATINTKRQEVLSKILELTDGVGVDYAIEATGNKIIMEAAFKAVTDRGGVCIIAGNPIKGEKILIDPFDLIKGKKIIGSWGGSTLPDKEIPEYIILYLSGKFKLDQLITHEYALGDINEALVNLEKGDVGRILINMSQCL